MKTRSRRPKGKSRPYSYNRAAGDAAPRLDPTRTATLRREFSARVRRLFARLKAQVVSLVSSEDAFGLRTGGGSLASITAGPGTPTLFLTNSRFRFQSNPEKVSAFRSWLGGVTAAGLTSDEQRKLWAELAEQAFRKGAARAYDDAHAKSKAKADSPARGGAAPAHYTTRDQFLRSMFARAAAADAVRLLADRSFTDLRGVTDATSVVLSRSLSDGLSRGDSSDKIARTLASQIDSVGLDRALTIVRTETVRAHAEGQLNAMDELGVGEVGAAVEWTTAGGAKVCPRCAPLEGAVFKVSEARGMLPRHPNCMCAWRPASSPGAKNTKSQIDRAVGRSLAPGEDWGPAVPVSRKRPLSNELCPELLEFSRLRLGYEPAVHVFCPTGEGGGVDPSCSPRGVSGGARRPKKMTKSEMADKDSRSPKTPDDVKQYADELARVWGYDQNKVVVRQGEGPRFVRGDVTWTEIGNCDLRTGDITIHDNGNWSNYRKVRRLVTHELMHGTYETVWTRFEDERRAIMAHDDALVRAWDAEHPGESLGARARGIRELAMTRASGELKPEHKDSYPTYARVQSVFEQSYSDLIRDDGVTPYSEAYWRDALKGRVSYHIAVHETLAEMAAVHETTGTVPGSKTWKKYYKTVRAEYDYITGKKKPRKAEVTANEATSHETYFDAEWNPTTPDKATYVRVWEGGRTYAGMRTVTPPPSTNAWEPFAAAFNAELSDNYDPSQPRDEVGRWTAGAGAPGKKVGNPTKAGVKTPAPAADSLAVHTGPDGKFNVKRARLHAKLVGQRFAGKTPVPAPVVYVMGGGPAAGKSTIIASLGLTENRVNVAPDDVKEQLPEYKKMVAAGDVNAGMYVHRESSAVGDLMIDRAVAGKYNVLIDGTGDGRLDGLDKFLKGIKARGSRVVANYVTVDPDVAVARMLERGKRTGRYVPESVTRLTHRNVSRIVPEAIRRGVYDEFTLWDTDTKGRPPVKVASARGTQLTVHDHARWAAFLKRGE
jgi:SPP1 gp7 family putative phage head morphogenesis protein